MKELNKISANSNYISESSSSSIKSFNNEESAIGYSFLSSIKNKTTVIQNIPSHQDQVYFKDSTLIFIPEGES